jgi:hypothetical protein
VLNFRLSPIPQVVTRVRSGSCGWLQTLVMPWRPPGWKSGGSERGEVTTMMSGPGAVSARPRAADHLAKGKQSVTLTACWAT